MKKGLPMISCGDSIFQVTFSGDFNLIRQWFLSHGKKFDGNGLWPIHFHLWVSNRSTGATIKVLWQGWKQIHLWIASWLVVQYYKFGLKRNLDVNFWDMER